MDPRYEPYFRNRIQQIRREGSAGGALQSGLSSEQVFDAVEEGTGRHGTSPALRPDGELLLYLAFTELVARPVATVRGREVNLSDLLSAISSDAGLITDRAVGGGPASAHDVINATARSWSRLRTAGWDLWD